MLHANRVRQAYVEGRPSFGVYARIPAPAAISALGATGLDFVRIDMVENHVSADVLSAMIYAAHASGVTPFVRVPRLDTDLIRAALDMGALGVIVPEIEGAADLAVAVKASKLSPVGERRIGLSGVDGYGQVAPSDYGAWAAQHVMLAVQIETRRAVEELDAILAEPALDMVLGGRGTLSAQFGLPGQRDHPRVLEIESMIMQKARAAGKITSVTHFPLRDPRQSEVIRNWLARGMHSICLGTDTDFVHVYRALLRELAGAEGRS
jgi:4-hydroxy-2-oxoheptanedioate aldolase